MTNVTDAAAKKIASSAADHPRIPALAIGIMSIVCMVVAIGTIIWMHLINVRVDKENEKQRKEREKQHGRTRRLLQQQDNQEKALIKRQDDEEKELIAKGLKTIRQEIENAQLARASDARRVLAPVAVLAGPPRVPARGTQPPSAGGGTQRLLL